MDSILFHTMKLIVCIKLRPTKVKIKKKSVLCLSNIANFLSNSKVLNSVTDQYWVKSMCYRIFVCTWKGPASIIHIFQSGRWHGLLGSQWSIFFGAHAHTYHLQQTRAFVHVHTYHSQHFLVRTHVPFVTYMCTHTRTICNTFLTRAATLFNSIKQKTVYFCSTRVELFVTLFLMHETVIHCTLYSWVIHKTLLPGWGCDPFDSFAKERGIRCWYGYSHFKAHVKPNQTKPGKSNL